MHSWEIDPYLILGGRLSPAADIAAREDTRPPVCRQMREDTRPPVHHHVTILSTRSRCSVAVLRR